MTNARFISRRNLRSGGGGGGSGGGPVLYWRGRTYLAAPR